MSDLSEVHAEYLEQITTQHKGLWDITEERTDLRLQNKIRVGNNNYLHNAS